MNPKARHRTARVEDEARRFAKEEIMKFLISLMPLIRLIARRDRTPKSPETTMAVDFSKPIQTIDSDPAELLRDLNAPIYKHLVLVTDAHDDTQTSYAVSDAGDTEDAVGFIENVEPEDQVSDIEEEPEVIPVTILDLPKTLQPRVIHAKRGPGRLVKVRQAPDGKPGKTIGIMLDSGKVQGDGGILWALDKNVRLP
jgi:hypothetical protein